MHWFAVGEGKCRSILPTAAATFEPVTATCGALCQRLLNFCPTRTTFADREEMRRAILSEWVFTATATANANPKPGGVAAPTVKCCGRWSETGSLGLTAEPAVPAYSR